MIAIHQARGLVTAAALLAVASAAQGQQQSNSPADGKTGRAAAPVQQVIVTGKESGYDPRRDDTAAKIIVGGDELAKYGDPSVADALKRVPGVTVVSTGRGADIRMRGLGGGYTRILLNGERAPSGFSVDSLSPSQVERIEVIRSAIAEFSTESVAGTINIVLRKAVRSAQRQIQLGYGGDATERTPRATFLLADRKDRLSYSLSAYFRHTTLDRDSAIVDVDTAGPSTPALRRVTRSHDIPLLTVLNLVPRLSWTLANGDIIASESFFSYTKRDVSIDRVSDPGYPGLNLRLQGRDLSGKSEVAWHTRVSPDTRFELKLGVQAFDGNDDSNRLVRGALASLLNTNAVDTTEHGFSTSGKLASRLGDAHQLTSGWEASRIRRDEMNDESDAAGPGASPSRTLATFTGTLLRAAAFVQDEWTVTPHLSIYVGARFEHLRTDIGAAGQARTTSSIWSPIAQTLIKLPDLPNDQLRVALTRTFKAPEPGELIPRRRRNEINAPTLPDIAGTPLLRPEIARGVDITYEHFFSKTAMVSVGVSTRDIDDYTLTNVSLEEDGRWVGRPVNAGRARVRSVELEAKFPLTLLKSGLPAVELRGSLGRHWSSVDQVAGPGNRVSQQVPLQASLSADHTIGPVTAGASFIFRKGAWTRVTAAQSRFTVNRRDLDLYALWKLNARQQLRITVGNLLAEDNITGGQFLTANGSTTRTTIIPGHVSVRALFEHKF